MSAKALQRVQQCIESQTRYAKLNAFVSTPDAAQVLKEAEAVMGSRDNASPLNGKLVAIKDNIATSQLRTTAASKILGTYTSPYDAAVVEALMASGAIIAGKTNLDEFGMGSHSRSPFSKPVLNRVDRHGEPLSAGGSSGGSAVAVATRQCWAALGTDTGGSVRLPAAYTGVVGFKPSYGRVSRWGVIAYANSLDTVGTLTHDVGDAEALFRCLDRHDERDPTSLPVEVRERIARHTAQRRHEAGASRAKLRIGIPLEYNIASLASPVKSAWTRLLTSLQSAGHTLHPVSLPATQQALSAYYVLAPAEASSNLAKYDGVRYGSRAQGPDASPGKNLALFAKTRGEGFGPEVQRRILLGAYTLSSEAMDNYFVQAQRVRRLVQRDFDRVFALPNPLHDQHDDHGAAHQGGVDVLVAPTAPTLPPTLAEVDKQTPIESYMNDVFTVPASLAGLPVISLPVKPSSGGAVPSAEQSLVGMQIIGQFGDDEGVLEVGRLVQDMERVTSTASSSSSSSSSSS